MSALRCNACGRFIAERDLISGAARRILVTPDSHFTRETYETLCARCLEEGREFLNAECPF